MAGKNRAVFYKAIRFLLFLAGTALLIWFIIPVYYGILNIGNLSGMAVSVLWMAVCLFYRQIKAVAKRLWNKNKAGKIVVGTISIILTVSIVCTAVLSGMMLYAANKTPPQEATMVVLGCKVNGTVPSLMLTKRLESAQKYLSEHPKVFCVVSGGQGAGEDISEAQAMKNYLVGCGIEESRIFMENQSTDTLENISFSKEVIEQNGLSKQIAVVTDGFHELRAGIIAKKQGVTAYGVAADTPWFTFSAYYVRELFALMKEIFLHG